MDEKPGMHNRQSGFVVDNQVFWQGDVVIRSNEGTSTWDHAVRSFVGGLATHLGTVLVDGIVSELQATGAHGDEVTFHLTCVGALHKSFDGYWYVCNQENTWWIWYPFHGWIPARTVPPIVLMARYYKDDKGHFLSQTGAGWFWFVPGSGWQRVSP